VYFGKEVRIVPGTVTGGDVDDMIFGSSEEIVSER
jgi:hypothetical protein